MLQRLHIENYALITRLDLTLGAGFTVLTGETGAGKSIILGALGMLCGQRTDLRALKQGTTRCVVEAEFEVTGFGLETLMQDNDLDFDGQTIVIRRELSLKKPSPDSASVTSSSLKSRAFVNDTPVPLSLLKTLGDRLIDIHSQHQNLLLGQQDFQLGVLDRMADNHETLAAYQQIYTEWRTAQRLLAETQAHIQQAKEEEDYLRYQVEQLDGVHLHEGEQAELEAEADLLTHAEEIKQQLTLASGLLGGDETDDGRCAALASLRLAADTLRNVADKLPSAQALSERLQSDYIDLQDIAEEMEQQAEQVDVNPQRATEVDERLQLIYDLERKHHVDSDSQLISLLQTLQQRLADIDHADANVAQQQEACERLQNQASTQAKLLTKSRAKAAKQLEKHMTELLQPLGMPHARFAVKMATTSPTPSGCDAVSFLFSGNKNGQLYDVASVASGGEIARVMLSLKALIANASNMPTLILDEIDTGLSGAVADKMGRMMQQMAQGGRQVLSITHLPQIAARGTDHLQVSKDERGDAAESHITRLTPQARVEAIAHLLSGEQLTQAARDNAIELLRNSTLPQQ